MDWGHNWKLRFWWRSLSQLSRKSLSKCSGESSEAGTVSRSIRHGRRAPGLVSGDRRSVRGVLPGRSPRGAPGVRGSRLLPPQQPRCSARRCRCPRSHARRGRLFPTFSGAEGIPPLRAVPVPPGPPAGSPRPGAAPPAEGSLRPGRRPAAPGPRAERPQRPRGRAARPAPMCAPGLAAPGGRAAQAGPGGRGRPTERRESRCPPRAAGPRSCAGRAGEAALRAHGDSGGARPGPEPATAARGAGARPGGAAGGCPGQGSISRGAAARVSGGVRRAGGGGGSRLSLPQQRVPAGGKGEAALSWTFVGVGVVLCVWVFFKGGGVG